MKVGDLVYIFNSCDLVYYRKQIGKIGRVAEINNSRRITVKLLVNSINRWFYFREEDLFVIGECNVNI